MLGYLQNIDEVKAYSIFECILYHS